MAHRIWTPASPPPPPRSHTSPAGSPLRRLHSNSNGAPKSPRAMAGLAGTMVMQKRRPEGSPHAQRRTPTPEPENAGSPLGSATPQRAIGGRGQEDEDELAEGGTAIQDGMGEESMVVSHSQPEGLHIIQRGSAPSSQTAFKPMDIVEIPDSDDEPEEREAEVDESDESDEDDDKVVRIPVHIEVRMQPHSTILFETIRRTVGQYITSNLSCLEPNAELPDWQDIALLHQHVASIRCAECERDARLITVTESILNIYVYQPHETDVLSTFAAATQSDDATTGEEGFGGAGGSGNSEDVAASVLELPAIALEGVWDSLIYEDDVKSKLLNYIYSTIRFSERDVDHNLISWHRLVLLHGPPGTGKTSLCRGLAQKLSIRLSTIYDHTRLVEINSHSLFSKWFSESGKLVQRLFQQVTEMVEDESTFVVVLIDEVESLTSARAGAMSGKEPSDALRVVNALLTQLDKLKQRKNVLVLTTSNLSAAIDAAFVDRADIKQYIGLPPVEAVYWVLRTCVAELMKGGLVRRRDLLDYRQAVAYCGPDAESSTGVKTSDSQLQAEAETKAAKRQRRARAASATLLTLAGKCHAQGMSGRSLRRLPLLADARCVSVRWTGKAASVETFLDAMASVIEEQKAAMDKMEENSC